MQTFQSQSSGEVYAYEDDVTITTASDGTTTGTAPDGSTLSAVPTDLTPYTPPAPTAAQKLQAAKDAKLAEFSAAYAQAIAQPVSFTSADGSTKQYQADAQSRANLSDMLLAFQKAAATPSGFYWVAEDNTQVPFTYADLQGLAEAMGTQGNTAFQHLQALKAQVNAVTTSTSSPITTVQAITW